jgi:membrane associated rhomboid family serine protease
MSLKTFILPPLKIYLKIVALILIVNLIFEILLAFFNATIANVFFIWNPLINSFIHTSWEHLLYNLLALFLFLLPTVNHSLGFKRIVFFTTVIACVCFPFEIFQLTLPIVGVSGLFYFLMTRFVLSIKNYKVLVLLVFGLLVIGEIAQIGNNDNVSHFCHLTGVFIGFLEHFIRTQKNTILTSPHV